MNQCQQTNGAGGFPKRTAPNSICNRLPIWNLVGFGTIAMTPSGIFIKTEAQVTRFDDIKIVGVGSSASAYVEGTPDVVAGTVAIGFKF